MESADPGGAAIATVLALRIIALGGVWEGFSTPFNRQKEPTKWMNCHIVFVPDGAKYHISGEGTSVWKSESIPFQILGHLEPATRLLELHKVHVGAYSNETVYHGKLDVEKCMISGEYTGGGLTLVRTGDLPPRASPATDSVATSSAASTFAFPVPAPLPPVSSSSTPPTLLIVTDRSPSNPVSPPAASVTSPMSPSSPSLPEGPPAFPRSLSHPNSSINSSAFAKSDANAPTLHSYITAPPQLRATTFASSFLAITPFSFATTGSSLAPPSTVLSFSALTPFTYSSCSSFSVPTTTDASWSSPSSLALAPVLHSTLSGLWDGRSVRELGGQVTEWNNCDITFETPVLGGPALPRIYGHGTSRWRGEVVPFTLEGVYDPMKFVGSLEKIHQGKYTNRLKYSIRILPKDLRIEGEYREGRLVLYQRQRPLIDNSSYSASTSSVSAPVASGTSPYFSFAECMKSSTQFPNVLQPPSLVRSGADSYPPVPGGAGAPDVVAYPPSASASASPPSSSSASPYATFPSFSSSSAANRHAASGRVNVSSSGSGSGVPHDGAGSSRANLGSNPSMIVAVDAAGTVTTAGAWSSDSASSRSDNSSSPLSPRILGGGHARKSSLLPPVSVSPVADSSADAETNKLAQYKFLLRTMVISGKLSPQQLAALDQFRQESQISEAEHNYALQQLDLTPEQFKSMQDSAPPEDADLCKICFDSKIDCVLLPCGHLAICFSCAKNLDKCPVCRAAIKEPKFVYRS